MAKKFTANKPILKIDLERLKQQGVSSKILNKYLPKYILEPTPLYYGIFKKFWFCLIRKLFEVLIWLLLKPRLSSAGKLDLSEIDTVYSKEARTYDKKHHMTTRGMDLVWRRMAGWLVAAMTRHQEKNSLMVLDICTGTGLTIKEMLSVLALWNIKIKAIGLDYNAQMLNIAKNNIPNESTEFVRADAMNMPFQENIFDATTMMCGIGGICNPCKVFENVLKVLKPSGQFFMTDIHKPIPEQPGEWFCGFKWLRFPVFEMVGYEETTLPLVLKRLWGWRDPTLAFYLLPLTTYKDKSGQYWGFDVRSFEQESQRWWLSLPIMPFGKIIVEKKEINKSTAKERKLIFLALRGFKSI
ncbi:hypothetical protein CL633_01370 [bacterium]|nr:hypothetical protein [bacterium]|tara:strand:+ start:16564 stop:17628 length:1065 start_codon:yes stop_codon:yes gene_type:complete